VSRHYAFDAAPLLAFAGRQLLDQGHPASAKRLGAAIGVTPRQICRYRAGSSVMTGTADRAAIALGVHPSAVWPEWFA